MKALSILLIISFLAIGCGSGGGGGEDLPQIQPPAKTTISGTVLDDNGDPVEGAEVTIHSDPVTVITDSNGDFSVEVEVGTHRIIIKKGPDEIYSKKFTCSDNVPLSFDKIRTSYDPGNIYIDGDGDGHTENQGDCDDSDDGTYPGAVEICGDNIDQDCNGSDSVCPLDRTLISSIDFVDSNLEACVDAEANSSAAIYTDELTSLDCYDFGITDITGIAWFTNLQYLSFWLNSISDISDLAGLTNLQDLDLDDNNIDNISVLAGLTNLQILYLSYNNISNISDLAGLINLQELDLWSNNISDISDLAGLANLQALDLDDNNIENVSVLAGLTSLQSLYLLNNSITSGVADLVTLVSAGDIFLNGNPQIPCNDLDTLENALGFSVVNRDYSPDCVF